MFERFNEAARRVVVLAQEEARLLRHNYIGTEHLLLALTHLAEGPVAAALRSAGVDLEDARSKVLEIIGQGAQEPSGHIPFTPRAKTVLELSLSEARRLGQSHIGTEHILLGLLREGEGVGAHALLSLGVDLPGLWRRLAAEVESDGSDEDQFVEPAPLPRTPAPPTSGFVGITRPAHYLQAPALVAIVAVLMGVFVASLGDDLSGRVQATVILWSVGVVGLAAALVFGGPLGMGGRGRQVARRLGLGAVVCFVVGSILYAADILIS